MLVNEVPVMMATNRYVNLLYDNGLVYATKLMVNAAGITLTIALLITEFLHQIC